MTVKELKEMLCDYNDDAKVIGVDWSNGFTYNVFVGNDEDDDDNTCYISFE